MTRVKLVASDEVQGQSGYKFGEKTATLEVLGSDLEMGHLRWVLVLWQAEETKDDVAQKEGCADILYVENDVVADVKFDSGKVHGGEATVDDDDEHDTVPKLKVGPTRVPLHLLLATSLDLLDLVTVPALHANVRVDRGRVQEA